jgi:hypothetical protein
MHLRLWVAGIGMGVLLVLGGLLAGPIESFAASPATPTTQQAAATPQAQGIGTSSSSSTSSGQTSGTPQNNGSSGTSSTNNMDHGCPQNSGGSTSNGTNGG